MFFSVITCFQERLKDNTVNQVEMMEGNAIKYYGEAGLFVARLVQLQSSLAISRFTFRGLTVSLIFNAFIFNIVFATSRDSAKYRHFI